MLVPPPAAHAAPERDDAEPVAAAQAAEQLRQRSLRLVELVARHRSGHVEYGDDVAPQRLSHLCGASRCEQQHERAVFPGRLLSEERHADEPSRERQEQLEVAAGGGVGQGEVQSIAAVTHRQPVRWRVGIAHAAGAVHLEAEAAGGGRRAGRVAEAQGVADPLEHLRVAQRDLARLPRGDGKDAGPQQAVAGQLDEGRVALAPHDLLVDRPRLRRVHRFPLELAISLPQRKVAEHRLAGERIEVTPLVHQGPRVPEPFFHGDARDATGHRDLHGAADFFDRAARQRPHRLDPALGECGQGDRAQCGGEPGQAFQGQHGTGSCEGTP